MNGRTVWRLTKLLALGAVLGTVPLAVASCTASGTVAVTPVVTEGTLTLAWTLNESTDPAECTAFGAADLELLVFDLTGAQITRQTATCEAGTMTVALPDGTYTAQVTLIDPTDQSVTTTLPLTDVVIVAGTDLPISVDFPASSHL